ncbi:MAG TPA: bacterial transcriptional activator domain-containing protein [Pseudonocardia sp.]|jgi:DNA-binding SARP family transcriptional activator|uniref:AfsR/SARP family transcriptional regulator n=1 Tax=Pseudonocardia sp. TaxID=60912 RepID=UPI002BF08CFC|nr:bacterial transcriptional activator domain-containing protein [Pseudonocardia sp.]HTF50974.1 bacterial transcriptional activator domain-containing protein [Pseudonocardia sp.]
MSDQQPCSDVPVPRPWLRVLGSFELRIPLGGGTRTDTATSPLEADERRLLALLAVTATPRTTGELATVLWPERSTDVALGTLEGVCDSLADLVTASGDTLRLSDHVEVDLAHALERLRAWKRNPFTVESTSAAELVELLAEDLLPGWGEVWARQERDRFRRVRLHALESLCRRLTEAGRHEPAIRAGMLVVAEEPLRESARRALIEAHLAAGNVSEAVKQYDAFVETCAKFGLIPGAELSAFFPPSPAWPVLTVRRPIHLGGAVGRGLRLEPAARRSQVGVGAVGVGSVARG